MKLLMHACCGPCACEPVHKLCGEGQEITLYFYNPNIHPYQEYVRRRDTFLDYAEKVGVPAVLVDEYGLVEFVRHVAGQEEARCAYCYRTRLQKTAEYAAANAFDAFTTSLLVSPYQKHDLIRQIAEEAAAAAGVPFYYEDFRPLYRSGVGRSRQLQLYRQGYCACIYSEYERYREKKEK